MKKNSLSAILFSIIIFLCFSCKKSEGNTPTPTPPVVVDSPFAKGADVSLITEMESTGKKFYNSSGTQKDATAAWANISVENMKTALYNRTTEVLESLQLLYMPLNKRRYFALNKIERLV